MSHRNSLRPGTFGLCGPLQLANGITVKVFYSAKGDEEFVIHCVRSANNTGR